MACITPLKSVIATGPTTATSTKAIAQAGPIMDYVGNLNVALVKLEEAKVLLTSIVTDTDSADPNLSTLNTLVANLG